MKIEISKLRTIKIEIDIHFHEHGESQLLYNDIIYYVKDILKSAYIHHEMQHEYDLTTHIVTLTVTLPNSDNTPLTLSKLVKYLLPFDGLGG